MDGVGADFVKYIKSFPVNTDFNAKNVKKFVIQWLINEFVNYAFF